MPKSAFPLTKSGFHTLRFRASYQWCLVTFSALNCDFRLLIAVNFTKEQYYAHLGMAYGGDTRMLGSFEFHGTHPGWHLHAGCDDVSFIPVGRYEGSWRRMLPTSHAKCRRKTFGIADVNRALFIAMNTFNVFQSEESESGQLRWT